MRENQVNIGTILKCTQFSTPFISVLSFLLVYLMVLICLPIVIF